MNRLRFFVIVHKRSAEKANNQRSIDKFEWICYDNFEKESFPAAGSPTEGRPPVKPTGRSAENGTPRHRGGVGLPDGSDRPKKQTAARTFRAAGARNSPFSSDGGRVKQPFPCPKAAEQDCLSPARRQFSPARSLVPPPSRAVISDNTVVPLSRRQGKINEGNADKSNADRKKDIRRLISKADMDGSACFPEASVYFIDKGHKMIGLRKAR